MPQRQPMLSSHAPQHAVGGRPDLCVEPGSSKARADTASAVSRLWRQACEELGAVGTVLASRCVEEGAVTPQLMALARTIARIGSTAEQLEREVVRVRHFANHDPLTGLPNRSLLLDRLDRALAQAARRGGQVGLLVLDLDEFKQVNDRFGHAVGDLLLQGVATRLQTSTRDADTVSRYGGDEFVVLLPEAGGRQGATVVAQKIDASLATPFVLDGHSITVSACIGIALYPLDGIAPAHLLQRADMAMYGAKDDPARRHLWQGGERPAGRVAGRSARRLHEVVSGGDAPGAAYAAGETRPGRSTGAARDGSNVGPDPYRRVPN